MCVFVQLKYVQLHTITLHQSKQVLVTLQYPWETVLIETHGKLGEFEPWWEEGKLHTPARQSST